MGKALIIKNADFSANAVETITFAEEVPCTGVAFDSATVTLNTLGIASIGYTLTPSNTTDTVTITSSDPTVVSVIGTTITAVGIGTATLTLTCGRYSATCAITVEIYETPNVFVGYVSTGTNANDAQVTGAMFNGNGNRLIAVKSLSDTSFSNAFTCINEKYELGDITAIEIPRNVTKIHVSATNLYSNGVSVMFIDPTSTFLINGQTFLKIISTVNLTTTSSSSINSVDEDVIVPSGAYAYIIDFRASSSSVTSGITTEAEAKACLTNTLNASIQYLAS